MNIYFSYIADFRPKIYFSRHLTAFNNLLPVRDFYKGLLILWQYNMAVYNINQNDLFIDSLQWHGIGYRLIFFFKKKKTFIAVYLS